jgi:hypothetical protein
VRDGDDILKKAGEALWNFRASGMVWDDVKRGGD